MTLKLLAPGARRGNRSWLVYGRHDGRVIERSTRTTDEAEARVWLARFLNDNRVLAEVHKLRPSKTSDPTLPFRAFNRQDRLEAIKLNGLLDDFVGEIERNSIRLAGASRALVVEEVDKIKDQLRKLERFISAVRRNVGVRR